MRDMHEFVDMLQPAAPEFRIPVAHENHADSDAQQQKRERPQLFHKIHSHPPRTAGTSDNFSTEDISFAKLPGFKIESAKAITTFAVRVLLRSILPAISASKS